VAIIGETVVVGADRDDVGANADQGSAYVFVRNGTTWNEQAKLTASDGARLDVFGGSVAIIGETVVVGAGGDAGANITQGSAYVFVRSGTAWNEQAKLTASDGAPDDTFGFSVAISGQTVVVGAPFANTFQGATYIFTAACPQAAANQPPGNGVNLPADGSSRVGQMQQFVTTCSDPDGWRDIHTIDFKIAKGNGQGIGEPVALWVQFDENDNLIRFYDPDTEAWSVGAPGQNAVLSSRFADLYLANTIARGSGPTGPSVQISWEVVFKDAAVRNNYKQSLRIEDDAGLSTGTDRVGRWSVTQ
jgi:hypothetical protein